MPRKKIALCKWASLLGGMTFFVFITFLLRSISQRLSHQQDFPAQCNVALKLFRRVRKLQKKMNCFEFSPCFGHSETSSNRNNLNKLISFKLNYVNGLAFQGPQHFIFFITFLLCSISQSLSPWHSFLHSEMKQQSGLSAHQYVMKENELF